MQVTPATGRGVECRRTQDALHRDIPAGALRVRSQQRMKHGQKRSTSIATVWMKAMRWIMEVLRVVNRGWVGVRPVAGAV